MLKANQKVMVRWNNRNKKYYEKLGYVFTANGEYFEVSTNDLTHGSKAMVTVICDYCGAEIAKKYQTYIMQHSEKYGDACRCCQPKKNSNVCMDKYGVINGALTDVAKDKRSKTNLERYGSENVFDLDEFQQKARETKIDKYGSYSLWKCEEMVAKQRQTMIDRYGVDNSFKSKEISEKIKSTNLDRYGVEKPLQLDVFKDKVRETSVKRFGVNNYSKTDECKEKIKQTNLKKYGYEHTLQVPEIREKGMKTPLSRDGIPTSKQQIAIYDMLIDLYGKCELNKIVGACALDCVVEINSQLIDVEYDGYYWHKDRQCKDSARDEVMKDKGYKILRIIGNNEIPTKEEIKEKIDVLLTTDRTFQKIVLV